MSEPPPQDLMAWPKGKLADEVRRLRAVLAEHVERRGNDPRALSSDGPVVDVAGDPYALGGVVLDTRSAVHLESTDVSLVDSKRKSDDAVFAFLVLSGRVNLSSDRVSHAYMVSADGAAALVTELVALSARAETNEQTAAFSRQFNQAAEERIARLEVP